jgi:hypothetical protein
MKIRPQVDIWKMKKITKIKVENKIRRDNCAHFFLEEVYDDTF